MDISGPSSINSSGLGAAWPRSDVSSPPQRGAVLPRVNSDEERPCCAEHHRSPVAVSRFDRMRAAVKPHSDAFVSIVLHTSFVHSDSDFALKFSGWDNR